MKSYAFVLVCFSLALLIATVIVIFKSPTVSQGRCYEYFSLRYETRKAVPTRDEAFRLIKDLKIQDLLRISEEYGETGRLSEDVGAELNHSISELRNLTSNNLQQGCLRVKSAQLFYLRKTIHVWVWGDTAVDRNGRVYVLSGLY